MFSEKVVFKVKEGWFLSGWSLFRVVFYQKFHCSEHCYLMVIFEHVMH